ncbi:putative Radial spoke head protein 6-like protein A [Hypsibius exemplaris]|uniref:Radial spoke head protein 6-like protein A n=1 Tax=Hypsibius exemplaris TaxID=2072580 RepID=A0A1W0WFC5_HYPEX|nr:putative Radial spoke head protein 6-like protein A [Hypsibius exemplaris]
MLNNALRRLLDFDAKILTVKFWGVINGLKNDYYIAETDADPPDDEEEEAEADAEKNAEGEEEKGNEIPEIEGFENLPPIPKPMLKPLPSLVKEPSGSGINRNSYYVATKLDGTWVRLPPATPDQIIISRKIHRGFTGDLKAKVSTFPVFPGVEANYLRAQIARISAATQICPEGYYMLDGEEDFEQGAAPPFNLLNNPQYKPPAFQDLSQPHMKVWMHCGQYILRQGRTFFYDAFEANRDEDEDEDEDERVRQPKYPVWYPEKADWYEPENTVPPPLCSVMNDAAIEGCTPWSLHFGSKTFPSHSFIVARSNLWPGANTILHDQGKSFFNIYFGNGLKYRSNFVPKMPSHVKHEKYDPTLHEEIDPTPEEEEEIRKAAGLDETGGKEEEEDK